MVHVLPHLGNTSRRESILDMTYSFGFGISIENQLLKSTPEYHFRYCGINLKATGSVAKSCDVDDSQTRQEVVTVVAVKYLAAIFSCIFT